MTASSYGVIFDLDGVLTDTAEFHYLAWQALADDEGIPFDRDANEQLRGVSRRDSLLLLLGGREVGEAALQDMMERKNDLYLRSLEDMSPQDTLPGAISLVLDAKRRGMRVAIGSSSKNAPFVLDKLGIAGLFDAVADGNSVEEAKPAPDLFLHAAELLGLPPARCVVIEDAASGVDAALAAGMTAIGVGPDERVGHAQHRWPSTAAVDLDAVIPLGSTPAADGVDVADGWIVVDGPCPPDPIAVGDGGWRTSLDVPEVLPVACGRGGRSTPAGPVPVMPTWSHRMDVRYGLHRRRADLSDPIRGVEDHWFVPLGRPNLLVRRQVIEAAPGTVVACQATIDATAWLGSTAIVATREEDGIRCGEVASDDVRLVLAMATRIHGGEVANEDDLRGERTHHHRSDVEVGADGRVVVERFLALGAPGAAPTASETVRNAASSGFEALLAQHALHWEDVWSSSDVIVDDPVAQCLVRYDRSRMVAQAAASGWSPVDGTAALSATTADQHEVARSRDAGPGSLPYERFIATAAGALFGRSEVAASATGSEGTDGWRPGTVWTTFVQRFAGIRHHDDRIEVEPAGVEPQRPITCRVPVAATWLEVTSAPGSVEVRLAPQADDPLSIVVAGEGVTVEPGETRTFETPTAPSART